MRGGVLFFGLLVQVVVNLAYICGNKYYVLMEQQFCQSCGMPLAEGNRGTNADGSRSGDYCAYCYKEGRFTQDFTMTQMVEFCLQFLGQMNAEAGWNLTPVEAKEWMLECFPSLKRWRGRDERSLAEKAEALLAQCDNVTVASIDAEGYPRPVQMSKVGATGFSEVWMATSTASVKVANFRHNNKAGLCYDHYGDGVALRGTVEVVDDAASRKVMWQDWFIHHFPGGPADPGYVLLHFVGTEATYWINGEFAHEPCLHARG